MKWQAKFINYQKKKFSKKLVYFNLKLTLSFNRKFIILIWETVEVNSSFINIWDEANSCDQFKMNNSLISKMSRGWLVQWKSARFVKFSSRGPWFDSRRGYFFSDAIYFALMFDGTSNYRTSYNLAISIGKCYCDTFYWMKGERSPENWPYDVIS